MKLKIGISPPPKVAVLVKPRVRDAHIMGPKCQSFISDKKGIGLERIYELDTWGATVDGRNPANHLGCVKPCK